MIKKINIRKIKLDKYDVAIIVLSVVAVTLGVMILIKNGAGEWVEETLNSRESVKNEESISGRQDQGMTRQAQMRTRPTPGDLTEDEKMILFPPPPGTPQEETDAFYAKVREMGVASNTLDLNNCGKPDPLVVEITEGEELEVTNDDDIAHSIKFGDDVYKVEANSTLSITAEFDKGYGTYGYVCDDLTGVVGYVNITQNR